MLAGARSPKGSRMLPRASMLGAGQVGDREPAEVQPPVLQAAVEDDGVRLDAAGAQHVGAERQRHLVDRAVGKAFAGEQLRQRARLDEVGAVGGEVDGREELAGLLEAAELDRAPDGALAGRRDEVGELLRVRPARSRSASTRKASICAGRADLAAPPDGERGRPLRFDAAMAAEAWALGHAERRRRSRPASRRAASPRSLSTSQPSADGATGRPRPPG